MILSTNSSSSQSPDSTSVDLLVTASFLPEPDTATDLQALHNKNLNDHDPNSMTTMATSYTSFPEATAHPTLGHSTHYHYHYHSSHPTHNAQPMNEMTDFQDVSTVLFHIFVRLPIYTYFFCYNEKTIYIIFFFVHFTGQWLSLLIYAN